MVADSTIQPTHDASLRDGMYFQNKVAGTKYNLYFFGGTNEVIKVNDIKCLYTKLYIDGASMPFLHIYTKPAGDGSDAQPWYNSKWTYTFLPSTFTQVGTEVVLASSDPGIDFNVDVIQSENLSIDGPGTNRDVLFLALGSDSSDSVDTVRHCINLLGFKAEDANGLKTEKNFSLVSRVDENYGRVSRNIVNGSVLANADIGDVIDLESLKNINITGEASDDHPIYVHHSVDGTTFYLDSEHSPVASGATFHYNIKIQDELRYVKLVNSNNPNTFTLNYTIF